MKIPLSLAFFFKFSLLLFTISVSQQAFAFHPCIDFSKQVSPDGGMTWYDANTQEEAVSITAGATYKFTTTACYPGYGYTLLNPLVSDDVLQVYQSMGDLTVTAETQSFSFTVEAPGICEEFTGDVMNSATVTTTATDGDREVFLSASDDAWIRCEPGIPGGGEGCTPGYWKQPHHFDSWPEEVTPDTLYSAIFDRVITVKTKDSGMVTDPTMLQALSAQGGKVNTAARHSSAAYLNSVSSGVSYDLSSAQVISNLQTSVDDSDFGGLIEALVSFNEQGCPLN